MNLLHEREASSGSPTPTKRVTWWNVAAVVAVVSALVTHVYVAWSARSPVFPYDEVTYLQLARLVAGEPPGGPVDSGGYYPGWSIVMAPVWWMTQDPEAVYRIAIGLGVALALVTIWPLSRLLQRWNLTTAQSIVVAAGVMCLPSRALQSDFVLSEHLLMLLVVSALLAGVRLWEHPNALRALSFAALVASAYLTHARILPFVLAAGIWLLFFVRRSWPQAVLGLVSLGVLAWLANRLATELNDRLVEGTFAQAEGFTRNLEMTSPGLLAVSGLGQTWYQLVATFGVVAIGAVVIIAAVVKELRRWTVGPAGLVFGSVLAMMLLSVLAWSGEHVLYAEQWRRLDAWLYGRYADPFTAVIAGIGLASIVTRVPRRILTVSAVAAGAVVAVVLLKVAPLAPTWGYVTPAHIPGVMPWWGLLPAEPFDAGVRLLPWFTNDNRFWIVASLAVAGGLILAAVLRTKPKAYVCCYLIAAVVATVFANQASNQFQDREGARPQMPAIVDRIENSANLDIEEIDFDRECRVPSNLSPIAQNKLAFWFSPRDLNIVWPSREPFTAELVVSCIEWPAAAELGARAVVGARDYNSQLWVLPGDLQNELAARGMLAPAG